MLKKSASGVLTSLRSSTYRSVRRLASSLVAALLGTSRVSARQGWAGEKSGHFEHPASRSCAIATSKITGDFEHKLSFLQLDSR